MKQQRLLALLEEFLQLPGETHWLEFKVNNFDPDRIGTLISAISNAARLGDESCGYVVWGIEDGTHQIVGTTFRPTAASAKGQALEFWLAKALAPSIHFVFHELNHPRGRVVILEIPAAATVPTKFNNIPYLRIGQATPKLVDFQEREASLLAKLRPFIWERGHAKTFLDPDEILDLLDVSSYFELTKQAIPGTNNEICALLAHDGMIIKDVGGRWDILNLGAILFAKNIQQFDGTARKAMRVIRYDGKTRTAETQEVAGQKGYASGFDGLINFVNKSLPSREMIGKSLRVARPIFPEIAVRELIANALIHQDMTISGAGPVVEIFNDRVEISNPGAPLVDTQRFIDFPPRSRNEALAALMRRIGVCEEQGSGIDKVIMAIEEAQLPPPDFRADGDNTKVILFGRKSFGEMSQEERVRGCYHHAVIRFLNNNGMTNGTLRQRFGVAERNASQISRVIKQTMQANLIKQSDMWSSRGGHYLPFWA